MDMDIDYGIFLGYFFEGKRKSEKLPFVTENDIIFKQYPHLSQTFFLPCALGAYEDKDDDSEADVPGLVGFGEEKGKKK
jgi:hypothetical protein